MCNFSFSIFTFKIFLTWKQYYIILQPRSNLPCHNSFAIHLFHVGHDRRTCAYCEKSVSMCVLVGISLQNINFSRSFSKIYLTWRYVIFLQHITFSSSNNVISATEIFHARYFSHYSSWTVYQYQSCPTILVLHIHPFHKLDMKDACLFCDINFCSYDNASARGILLQCIFHEALSFSKLIWHDQKTVMQLQPSGN